MTTQPFARTTASLIAGLGLFAAAAAATPLHASAHASTSSTVLVDGVAGVHSYTGRRTNTVIFLRVGVGLKPAYLVCIPPGPIGYPKPYCYPR